MRICVVGLGYVGLVTAGCLTEMGHEVVGIDAAEARVRALQDGRIPFHEPGLPELVAAGLASGRLRFSASLVEASVGIDMAIIAVGTTDDQDRWQTGTLDRAISDLVPLLPPAAVLVVRSTVPPAHVSRIRDLVGRLSSDRASIPVMLNPEFTREGSAVVDFLHPDRIVFGRISDPSGIGEMALRRVYASLDAPVLALEGVDAALAKLGSNLYLATRISFVNELASMCDRYGGLIDDVVAAVSLDPRIGKSYLRAGVGFGGSCLPNQVSETVASALAEGAEVPLLAGVERVNQAQRERVMTLLAGSLGGLEGRRIALLGLSFKPHTDDLRGAPSIAIAKRLLAAGADVVAYDPMPSARSAATIQVAGLSTEDTAEKTLAGADAIVLVTEWPEFRQIDWAATASSMRSPIIVDGRNALSREALVEAGFTYLGFGRGISRPASDGRIQTSEANAPLRVGLSIDRSLSAG